MIGKVITVLPDCQYRIRVDRSGSITFKNHHFLKKLEVRPRPTPILSAMPEPTSSTCNVLPTHSTPLNSFNDDAHTVFGHPIMNTSTNPHWANQQKFLRVCPEIVAEKFFAEPRKN